jgi:PAS domain S-box-containing protein
MAEYGRNPNSLHYRSKTSIRLTWRLAQSPIRRVALHSETEVCGRDEMTESAERLGVAPRALRNYLSYVAIVFLAYFVAGKLGQATSNIRSSNLGPVWPAYGVAVAALLLYGYRVWIGIAGAAFLVAFSSPVPHIAAAGQAAGATVAALTGAFLLHRIARFDPSLSRLRDALALIVFGALGSALVSASIGTSVLYATHVQAYSGLGSAWLIYWLGDSTGVLLVTPLVLTFPRLLKSRPWADIAEFSALLLILTAICFLVFAKPSPIEVELHVFAFVVLPFVMWAAIRFGVGGAALATFLVVTIATLETALGSGPFARNSPFVNAVLLDVFFAVLSVSGMTLAAVIAEREQAKLERERLVREQATLETRLQLSAIVQASDERFRLAAQAGKMYAYEWDATTDMVTRSGEYLRVLGLSGPETQVTRAQLSARVHPDDRALFIGVVGQVTQENPASRIIYRTLRSDGSVIWLEKNSRAFFDEQGRLRRMVGMVADITDRKLGEEALRESEDKLRLLLDSTAQAIYGIDLEGRCTFCNPACIRTLGYERDEEVLGKNMHHLIHHSRADGTFLPAEECRIYRALRTGEANHVDDEVLWRANGTSFPAEYWSHPQRRGQEIIGAVVAFFDITERKVAEAALASVSGRLIMAQEQERTRIARELHDDISQRLAILANELQQFQQDSPNLLEVRNRMEKLEKHTLEIVADVQSLSHKLHSSKLEYLGIVAAMRSFCKEFSERQSVKVDFSNEGVTVVPSEISLCLFRVLQEALHNALKHSGVRDFNVELQGALDAVQLTVRDSGVGFDPVTAVKGRGLGLTSMQERLKLVGGIVSINSDPNGGTTIQARVPLGSRSHAKRATG